MSEAPTRRGSVDYTPEEQLRAFRAYQRSGSYATAAAELGMSRTQVKWRLMALYRRIGARSAIQASFLLRDEPY